MSHDWKGKRKEVERKGELEGRLRTGEKKRCSLDSLQAGPLRLQAEVGVTAETMLVCRSNGPCVCLVQISATGQELLTR